MSSNVAAQLSTTARRSAQAGVRQLGAVRATRSPFTRAGRRRTFTPRRRTGDMFFDDVKTIYDLDAPDPHRIRVDQSYSDYRKGTTARLDSLEYLASARRSKVVDLDTAHSARSAAGMAPRSRQARTADHGRSAERASPDHRDRHRSRLHGRSRGSSSRSPGPRAAEHAFLLPAGWDASSVSQSRHARAVRGPSFVALINLNAENNYQVPHSAPENARGAMKASRSHVRGSD